jgi:hypothetical protein
MFRVLTITLIFFSATSVFGQKKKINISAKTKQVSQCQLTEAPTLRGFFLGQTVDEINKFIPGFKSAYNKEKESGNSTIIQTDYSASWENRLSFKEINGAYLSGYFNEDLRLIIDDLSDVPKTPLMFSEDANGLNKLVWWFFEDKLYGFSIYYTDYNPDSTQSFAKQLSEKTSLPRTGWIGTDKKGYGAVLKCDGFKVNVHTAYRDFPNITFTDTSVEAKVLRLEKEIKLQEKKEKQERIRLEKEKMNTLKP